MAGVNGYKTGKKIYFLMQSFERKPQNKLETGKPAVPSGRQCFSDGEVGGFAWSVSFVAFSGFLPKFVINV